MWAAAAAVIALVLDRCTAGALWPRQRDRSDHRPAGNGDNRAGAERQRPCAE